MSEPLSGRRTNNGEAMASKLRALQASSNKLEVKPQLAAHISGGRTCESDNEFNESTTGKPICSFCRLTAKSESLLSTSRDLKKWASVKRISDRNLVVLKLLLQVLRQSSLFRSVATRQKCIRFWTGKKYAARDRSLDYVCGSCVRSNTKLAVIFDGGFCRRHHAGE